MQWCPCVYKSLQPIYCVHETFTVVFLSKQYNIQLVYRNIDYWAYWFWRNVTRREKRVDTHDFITLTQPTNNDVDYTKAQIKQNKQLYVHFYSLNSQIVHGFGISPTLTNRTPKATCGILEDNNVGIQQYHECRAPLNLITNGNMPDQPISWLYTALHMHEQNKRLLASVKYGDITFYESGNAILFSEHFHEIRFSGFY